MFSCEKAKSQDDVTVRVIYLRKTETRADYDYELALELQRDINEEETMRLIKQSLVVLDQEGQPIELIYKDPTDSYSENHSNVAFWLRARVRASIPRTLRVKYPRLLSKREVTFQFKDITIPSRY